MPDGTPHFRRNVHGGIVVVVVVEPGVVVVVVETGVIVVVVELGGSRSCWWWLLRSWSHKDLVCRSDPARNYRRPRSIGGDPRRCTGQRVHPVCSACSTPMVVWSSW